MAQKDDDTRTYGALAEMPVLRAQIVALQAENAELRASHEELRARADKVDADLSAVAVAVDVELPSSKDGGGVADPKVGVAKGS